MDFENLNADVNMFLDKHYTSGRGGKNVGFVGIHYNAGDLTVGGCYSVWQTREASAHYQVESGGTIGQLVHDWDTAWALGDFDKNQRSINIEHANKPDGTVTEACLDSGAHLTAAICKNYGLGRPEWGKNVIPHKAIMATACPGELYGSQKQAYIERAQYWYDKMTGGSPAEPSVPSSPSGGLEVDGYIGKDSVSELQRQIGTPIDGVISSQDAGNKKYLPNVTSITWEGQGSQLVVGLQKFLVRKGYSVGASGADGLMGKNTVIAIQQFLRNNCGYVKHAIDGYLGPDTAANIQNALNAGFFKQ